MSACTDYSSPEYNIFKKNIKQLTGLDLNSYKRQIHRRVHMLMSRWNINSYEDYFEQIRCNKDRMREFLDYLTINVSEFLRNPTRWKDLTEKVFPELVKNRGKDKLRIWSAGGATGEEPYSLAMVTAEYDPTVVSTILAADIDAGAIMIAKRGIYNKRQLANVPESWKKKFFTQLDDNLFEVNDEIKRKVNFKRMNIIEDSFSKGFDLILCRNVVIYFSADTKTILYNKFFDALRPGGYLLVGSTEQIFDYRKHGFESPRPFLYRKPL